MSGPSIVTLAAPCFTLAACLSVVSPNTYAQGPNPMDATKQTDQGIGNRQVINRLAGDHSVVTQTALPGSRGNVQTATTSSPGTIGHRISQRTAGSGNTQSAVVLGGEGSTVSQRAGAGSKGNVQSAVIDGGSNIVEQVQNGTSTGNVASVVQSGHGNHAVQSQTGRGQVSRIVQYGNQGSVAVQQQGRTQTSE